MKQVRILDTEVANIASIKAMLNRLGISYELIDNNKEIINAPALVMPGVGSFGQAMQTLNSSGFTEPLKERILLGLPTFAICLGLQLLCRDSEESPNINGLGIIDKTVKKFSAKVRVPHFGWNYVTSQYPELESDYAYFANSYRLTDSPEGWQISTSNYDGNFVSSIQKNAVIATQFHPELSGEYGEKILKRWIKDSLC